jgi:glutathione synthase
MLHRGPIFWLSFLLLNFHSFILSIHNASALVVMSSSTFSSSAGIDALPLESLSSSANAFAAANGIQVEIRSSPASDGAESSSISYRTAPISLLPNAYPRSAFQRAIFLAPHFNVLVDRISRDADFLRETLGGSVAAADPFTAQLLRLYNRIYTGPQANPAACSADRLGIQRSDYMLHKTPTSSTSLEPNYEIKQVELNTIASSFGGLSCQVAQLHTYLIGRFAQAGIDPSSEALRNFLETNRKAVLPGGGGGTDGGGDEADGVPINPSLERLPAALAIAVRRYQKRFGSSKNTSTQTIGNGLVVLFVVQEGETNTVDQRLLEFRLFQNHGIPVLRKSLRQLHAEAYVDPETGALKIKSPNNEGTAPEVAVVYYRAGYAPTDYSSDDSSCVEWQARERLECSRATKCPSLGYHLAGTKKVQQQLARPGVLERFLSDVASEHVQVIRQAFAGLYSLGEDAIEEDLAAVKDVLLADGQGRYVLKPQREGGGYNYYGEKLAQKLRENVELSEHDDPKVKLGEKLGEFILMERLFPPKQQAILLRAGKIEGSGETISELGCFGTVVASPEGEIVHNKYAGFLLRTKFSNVDEGGVASGFATLSSPYLC